MSDRVTAWLRTAVPGLWAALIVLLVTHVPALQPAVDQLSGLGDVVAVPLVLAAWKAVFQVLEPKLPAWLVQLVLGSAKVPTYPAPPAPVPPAA
jgi:hypothetical protein